MKPNIVFTCLLFLLTNPFGLSQETAFTQHQLHCSMAGGGDPWSALTKRRLSILMGLHQQRSLKEIADTLNLTHNDLMNELTPLEESHLIRKANNTFHPDIFIADAEETERIFEHAQKTGEWIARSTINYWPRLERAFRKLSIDDDYSLQEVGFTFAGARILDVGVLGALIVDGSLLPSAPRRPSATRPDGQYYFWLIDGKTKHLGKYGQDDTDLPWQNWHVLNFGQSWINDEKNTYRKTFEDRITQTIQHPDSESPEDVASCLDIPYLSKRDSRIWAKSCDDLSNKLLTELLSHKGEFQSFYATLKASKHTNNSFGEFFCWYYHIVYSAAIDYLVDAGMIRLPEHGYSGMVLYREGEEGILSQSLSNKSQKESAK